MAKFKTRTNMEWLIKLTLHFPEQLYQGVLPLPKLRKHSELKQTS